MTEHGQSDRREMTTDTYWRNAYDQHGGPLFAFLNSRVRRRDVAEDLLHETFVRAMGADKAIEDIDRLRAYLFTIAHNLVISRYRRKTPTLFSEAGSEDRFVELRDARATSPEDATVLSSLRERLEAAIDELPPNLQAAFVAAVVEKTPYKEIAGRQGWSPVQVRVNVHRARKKIMQALGDVVSSPKELTR